MRRGHLQFLVCPECRGDLVIESDNPDCDAAGAIETGTLGCGVCRRAYPIVRGVPRFVSSENYARGFGFQWAQHPRLQYDSYNGLDISARRFFAQTQWPCRMPGEVVLEVGCGAGRFTEQALSTGAVVVSVDYSDAVDVNYAAHGASDRVLIVQADVYNMPLRRQAFDRVFCFGVIQHTPDPERAFAVLATYPKPAGLIAVDVYLKYTGIRWLLDTKYWVRPVTRRMAPETLYRLVRRYIRVMWPVARLVCRIPYLGIRVNWRLLISDRSMFPLADDLLEEWAILDTFDMLGAVYDYPQFQRTVEEWFGKRDMVDVEVVTEAALVVGRARSQARQPARLPDRHGAARAWA